AVGLAVPEQQIEQSIYDVLISKSRNEPIRITEILWQIGERLDLAPASLDLSAFEQQMTGVNGRECCLRDVLTEVDSKYDYTIIDCPPAVGLLTFNALRAATEAIVPVETGYFALHGLSKQLETLAILCERCNQQVNVKVLASMYDIRTKMAREILAELKNHFSEQMFETIVNFNTKLKEAASFGQPISEYDPASKGQRDFKKLAEEVISTEKTQQRRELVGSLSNQLSAISTSANELLKTAKIPERKPGIEKTAEKQTQQIQTIPEISEEKRPQKQTPPETTLAKTEVKLSDYYGVSQMNNAVVFVTLYPRAKSVQIAGDFNNWQPAKLPMKKVGHSGVWQTKLKLPAGKYRYRLVVDGQWQQDPYNENTEVNPYGGFNSILEVK
ncbi:AAA family ATPase, partial [Planctomycetota bacterium]